MNIRCQCVEILQQILENKVFFSALKPQINEKDLPFANMLILTVLRHKTLLDKIFANYIKKKIPRKTRVLTYILYCGAVEILYLKTPDYAAIHEYVSIAKKLVGLYAGGMVNAVLRKIAGQEKEFLNLSDVVLPNNFHKLLNQDYSAEIIEKIGSMISYEPPLDITVKHNPAEWAQKLGGELFANGTVRIKNPKEKIASLPGFSDGLWWVQDMAASLPVLTLGNIAGLKVLDLCAAPGGKTAQLLAAGAYVWAVDADKDRMIRLENNIARLKLGANLCTTCMDAIEYLKTQNEIFDVILIDAPCSATGTFRRHPEVLHIKDSSDIAKLVTIQKTMLNCAAEKLMIGGRLLYCTCSLSKAEGENQAAEFLTSHPQFEIIPLTQDVFSRHQGKKLSHDIIDQGALRSLPYHMVEQGGMDSFYAVCLRKNCFGGK